MKKSIFKLTLISSLFISVSCDKLEKIGPDICPTNSFSYNIDQLIVDGLDVNSKVNLGLNGLNISTKFTEEVNWTLRITSSTSSKVFSEKSDSIDVKWFGNSDALPLFDIGDCKIEIEISCLEPFVKNFTITGKPTFSALDPSYGVLIRDWDKHGVHDVKDVVFTPDDGWKGLNGDIEQSFLYENTDPSFMGGYHAVMYSNSNTTTWYHGGHSFPVSKLVENLSTTNADSLYLNVLVYGYGLANTGVEIGFQATGKSFFYTTPLEWSGWKLISVKLSEFFVRSGSAVGEKLKSISLVDNVVLQLGSNPEKTSEAKSGYDFMLITVGKPFFKE